MLVDELIKAEKQGVDLSNELADKHEEITVLHKKLVRGGALLPPPHATPSAARRFHAATCSCSDPMC